MMNSAYLHLRGSLINSCGAISWLYTVIYWMLVIILRLPSDQWRLYQSYGSQRALTSRSGQEAPCWDNFMLPRSSKHCLTLADGLSHVLFYLEIWLTVPLNIPCQSSIIIFITDQSGCGEMRACCQDLQPGIQQCDIWVSHPEHDVRGKWPPCKYGQIYSLTSESSLPWLDVTPPSLDAKLS